jgi:intracellular multiplication protein IcmJ
MYPLELSINPKNWELFMRRKANPAFWRVSDKIFVRDLYTCRFCGFQAREYTEVINLDGDYRNNKLSNMVTACVFCAQCCFLEAVGQHDFGGGKLIYLPEMTQTELNSFCHVLFCAITNGTSYSDTAQSLYQTLKFRSQPIEDKFGVGMSDPSVFSRILLEYEGDPKDLAEKILIDFRLVPSYVKFRKQLERWAASAAEELASEK